jgi:PAS domain S-box-containing protein
MNTELTPMLLGELIDEGYIYMLVKQEEGSINSSACMILTPVKQKPELGQLPEGYQTFYKITQEPLQLACGSQDLRVLVDLSGGERSVLNNAPSIPSEDFYFRYSDDFFQQVFESMDEYAVFTTNLEGRINSWNTGAHNLLGYEEKEILGLNAAIIYTKKDKQENVPQKEMDDAIHNGQALNERYHVRKDGSQFWGSGLLFPLFDIKGVQRGYTKVMRNLSEKRETEHQILYAKAFSQQVIESSREPMAILNQQLLITAASDSFFELFQVDKRKALNKHIYKFAPALNTERLRELFERLLPSETSIRNFEFIYEIPDQTFRIMMIYIRKIESFIDKSEQIIMSIEDVTRERILQQEKDDFISIASHELRTPITMIKASGQILQRELKNTMSDTAKMYLDKLTQHTEKLVDLSSFLLDVSKIRTGRFSLQREIIDLCILIRETINDLVPVYARHEVFFEGPEDCRINADKTKIAQVIINLVGNAVKYSPDANKVIIKLTPQQDNFIVSIQDFGLGIPKSEQSKLFKRFSRTQTVRDKKIAGTGLGLYISAEFIKQHGGNIWVESEPNQGSTFFFSLPLYDGT